MIHILLSVTGFLQDFLLIPQFYMQSEIIIHTILCDPTCRESFNIPIHASTRDLLFIEILQNNYNSLCDITSYIFLKIHKFDSDYSY